MGSAADTIINAIYETEGRQEEVKAKQKDEERAEQENVSGEEIEIERVQSDEIVKGYGDVNKVSGEEIKVIGVHKSLDQKSKTGVVYPVPQFSHIHKFLDQKNNTGVKYGEENVEKHVLGHSEGESDSDPEEFIEEDIRANAVDIENSIAVDQDLEELCNITNDNEVEHTSDEACILRSAIGKLEGLCNIPNDNEVELSNIPDDNEVEPTSLSL